MSNSQYEQQEFYQSQPKDYENQVDENQKNGILGGSDREGGLFGNSRLGFIRKVYLILTAQLALTVLFCGISMASEGVREFQQDNIWLFYICWVLVLVTEITLFCFPNVAATVPTNYYLLGIFTAGFSWMVSMICGFYADEPYGYEMVFIAAGLTLGIVVGLTVYALTTKTDFTALGGVLCVMACSFLLFWLFLWIFNARSVAWVDILYCSFGVILFGFYLIYDTQIIAGGEHRRFKLDYDQYIIGAMILYIDIIQIFLYILRILARSRGN